MHTPTFAAQYWSFSYLIAFLQEKHSGLNYIAINSVLCTDTLMISNERGFVR